MRTSVIVAALAAALCVVAFADAQEGGLTRPTVREGGLLEVETLPYQGLTISRPIQMIVPRSDGGATAIFLYWRQNPSEAILLNMDTGEIKRDVNPGYGRPRGQRWGADGKHYIGLWSSPSMFRYNPFTDSIEHLGVLEPDGSGVPIISLGTDNKIYGMTSNKGHVFSVDPDTDEVIRYGMQGPERFGGNYTGTLGVDDDYIYSTFGNMAQEIHTVAMNKETREWVALEEIRGASIHQGDVGVTATHQGNTYWLYDGKAILQEAPDAAPPWHGKEPLERIAPPEFNGQPEILGDPSTTANINLDGTLSIYYRTSPDEEWQESIHDLEPTRLTFSRISTLPDERLFLSTIGYEGFYLFDPAEDNFERLGLASASHYCTVVHDNKVYMGSYPRGSSLIVWDPEKDWTAGSSTPERPRVIPVSSQDSNPRLLGYWPSPPRGFQHPRFLVLGADNTIYAAVHGERHNLGGMLAWYEIETGNIGMLRDPFVLYDVSGMCTALDGTKIAWASTPVRSTDGSGTPRPRDARIFVVDVATREVEWFIDPFEETNTAGMICEGRPGELVVALNLRVGEAAGERGSTLYTIDMETRQIGKIVELPGRLAGPREYHWLVDFKKGPDGMIYTLYDDYLVRIDPETLEITMLAQVGNAVHVAFSGRDAYVTGTRNIRIIRNLLDE